MSQALCLVDHAMYAGLFCCKPCERRLCIPSTPPPLPVICTPPPFASIRYPWSLLFFFFIPFPRIRSRATRSSRYCGARVVSLRWWCDQRRRKDLVSSKKFKFPLVSLVLGFMMFEFWESYFWICWCYIMFWIIIILLFLHCPCLSRLLD